uniref:C2H2-type domain-containing protein n=1 Tax=Acrobeloides nanus TaxID=290746 RepID=A0A914DU08_9BILA
MVVSYDNGNLEKVIQQGFRSRAKDSLAILERIPYPQNVKIRRASCKHHDQINENFKCPPTLTDIAFKKVSEIFPPQMTTTENLSSLSEIIEGVASTSRAQDMVKLESASLRGREQESKFAYYCNVCGALFEEFVRYDEHLMHNKKCAKKPDPIEIKGQLATSIPNASRIQLPKLPSTSPQKSLSSQIECTKCHETNFSTITLFHEHIFECSLNV